MLQSVECGGGNSEVLTMSSNFEVNIIVNNFKQKIIKKFKILIWY